MASPRTDSAEVGRNRNTIPVSSGMSSEQMNKYSQLACAPLRRVHVSTKLDSLHDFPIGEALVRKAAKRAELPEGHPQAPHVRLGGEHTVREGLGRHPAHR